MKKIPIFCFVFFALFFQQAWSAESLVLQGPANAQRITFQQVEEGKLLVSVTDDQDFPIMGLTPSDFTIRQGLRTAQVTQVEPLATSKDLALNIILVVDNSASMRQRNAIDPLLGALEAIYGILRPIDRLAVVVYDEQATHTVDGRPLHARILQSGDINQLRDQVREQLTKGLTTGTYLYDAMSAGLDLARQWPEKQNKLMVVLTDGEDINSVFDDEQVLALAQNLPDLLAYAVDYMPTPTTDVFLSNFAQERGGQIWKANSADELVEVFKGFSFALIHRYVVAYRFRNAPTGDITLDPAEITIEEIATIDSAPLLNYVFFDHGRSELPDRYVQLQNPTDTEKFSEVALRGAMEKYTNLLNIIGDRLRKHPEAAIHLVGCNSNTGEEVNLPELSRSRAEAVKAYLRYVWGIVPERMSVEARNLPEVPSTNRLPEGQAENRRVEIRSDHAAILDTVKSHYIEKVSTAARIRMVPKISAEAGIRDWKMILTCNGQVLDEFSGKGDPTPNYVFPLEKQHLDILATATTVTAGLRVMDLESNLFEQSEAAVLPIRFIQRREQLAQKLGAKVREKYALILFDFDSAVIKARNKAIVNKIVHRMNAVPQARMAITGHTDNIGKEDYNLQLSQKRAEAVREGFGGDVAPQLMTVLGVGPNKPMYDNGIPEGRALNRTVTVTLEYDVAQ